MTSAPAPVTWPRVAAAYDPPAQTALGMILLATDRASHDDVRAFLPPDVCLYSTRIPMDVVATPATLAAMEAHLEAGARVLVPGAPLHAIGFSCTSGTVAIGPDVVRERIGAARPGVPVANPVDAAADGLRALGATRIALLVPYLEPAAELIHGYLAGQGFEIGARATFDLDGDPEMNRVSTAAIGDAAAAVVAAAGAVDAVFISCTGLRAARLIEPLERRLGLPVVTSNQAHAWRLLRLAGRTDAVAGGGRLLAR